MDTDNNLTKKIILFILLPLLMKIFYLEQIFESFNISSSRIIIILQSMIFIISIRQIRTEIRLDKKSITLIGLFSILFFIALISGVLSGFKIHPFNTTLVVFSTTMMLILLILSDRKPYETFKKFSDTLIDIAFILSIIAIIISIFGKLAYIENQPIQEIKIGDIRIYQIVMGAPPNRVSSLINNPNTFGMILMFSQMATLNKFKTKLMEKKEKKKNIFIYFIQIIALMLTQSRDAILTAVIMIVIYSIVLYKDKLNRKKILIFLCAIIITGIIIFSSGKLNDVFIESRGLTDRDEAWKILINSISKNPFFGIGFGSAYDTLLSGIGTGAHNVFLNILSEIGIIGFAVFMSIWISGIRLSYISLKKNADNKEIKNAYSLIFAVLVSLLFHQFFENKLLTYDFVMFVWTYIIVLSIVGFDNYSVNKKD